MNDKTGRHSNASPSKLSVGYLTQNRVVSLFRVATCAFFSFVVACDDSPADSERSPHTAEYCGKALVQSGVGQK